MPAIGELAPDFELVNDEGRRVKLSDYRGKKVVLYFYPNDFTPGCELQSCNFRDRHDEITAMNAVVLGVSADDEASHREFRRVHGLPFNLLVDADFIESKKWGVFGTRQYPDGEFTGIIRSQYVINEDGRFIDVQAPVKATESVRLAVEALQRAAGN
jgi:peroxiredoxin Q/BCP